MIDANVMLKYTSKARHELVSVTHHPPARLIIFTCEPFASNVLQAHRRKCGRSKHKTYDDSDDVLRGSISFFPQNPFLANYSLPKNIDTQHAIGGPTPIGCSQTRTRAPTVIAISDYSSCA